METLCCIHRSVTPGINVKSWLASDHLLLNICIRSQEFFMISYRVRWLFWTLCKCCCRLKLLRTLYLFVPFIWGLCKVDDRISFCQFETVWCFFYLKRNYMFWDKTLNWIDSICCFIRTCSVLIADICPSGFHSTHIRIWFSPSV